MIVRSIFFMKHACRVIYQGEVERSKFISIAYNSILSRCLNFMKEYRCLAMKEKARTTSATSYISLRNITYLLHNRIYVIEFWNHNFTVLILIIYIEFKEYNR